MMRDQISHWNARGGGSTRIPPAEFRSILSRLKDEGCNLLVTGEVGADVTDAISRRLLGAADHPRKRVVALADRTDADAEHLLPEDVNATGPDVVIVDHPLCTRNSEAATGQPAPEQAAIPDSQTHAHRLQQEVCEAIVDLEMDAGGFDPSELRLAVVTLRTLLDRDGPDGVERLVRGVRAHVRGVDGMAHYHLPLPDCARPVQRLSGLFDARIELRAENGHPPEQRWHLPDDRVSPWIRL